jgi:mannose-6-phosphate isomerase-like protein (cupin superfamily)
MLLNNKKIKQIKNRKITYVKKFTQNLNNYNFDILASLIDNYSLNVLNKNSFVFSDTWQVGRVHTAHTDFFVLLDFFYKIFKYTPEVRDGVDLFFSFVTNTGASHVDEEDIFLVGMLGKTLYRITDSGKDYILEPGDLLYVPRGIRHKSMSLTPRIIASVGFLGGKSID